MEIQGAPAWALTVAAVFACLAFLALVGVMLMLFLWWRSRPGQTLPANPEPMPASREVQIAERSQSPASPTSTTLRPAELASAVRSLMLQQIVEKSVPGAQNLLLTPPAHQSQMTWHAHLAATVSLDLLDGRTVPTAPPRRTHDWALQSGNRAGLANGDPVPRPGPETRAVRVEGGYLSLRYTAAMNGAWELVIADGTATGQRLVTEGFDLTRVQQMVQEGLDRARSHASSAVFAMGYTPTSWRAHERLWIAVM